MDLSSRKNRLIEKILKVEEEQTIYELENILIDDATSAEDFWQKLPSEIRQLIDKGLDQSQNGNTKPHQEVITAIKKKYPAN